MGARGYFPAGTLPPPAPSTESFLGAWQKQQPRQPRALQGCGHGARLPCNIPLPQQAPNPAQGSSPATRQLHTAFAPHPVQWW